MQKIKIGKKEVAEFNDPLVIAEIGANFNGDLKIAKEMVLKAKEAGVDVAKFQSWRKETIFARGVYQDQESDIKSFGHEKLGDLLDFLSLTESKMRELKMFCDENDIMFSSTPISKRDVDFLDELQVPFFKIASMDLNHLNFIEYVAKKQKPIILSTGMGTMEEIESAVNTIKTTGNENVILLHCTALYPPEDSEVNLNNIDMLREKFQYQIGYSDHSLGITIPLAAVVKGASVLEKHYTLDKNMEGWDHAVSATPDEFKAIVTESKRIVDALGSRERIVSKKEEEKKQFFRRSVVAKRDLVKGETLTLSDIDFKRPGTGVPPNEYEKLLNRKINCDLKEDEVLKAEYFE